MCSGKVYYDILYEEREKRAIDDIYLLSRAGLSVYNKRADIQVCGGSEQAEMVKKEEPRNMGAWFFVNMLQSNCEPDPAPSVSHFALRGASSLSGKSGAVQEHLAQLKQLLEEALRAV